MVTILSLDSPETEPRTSVELSRVSRGTAAHYRRLSWWVGTFQIITEESRTIGLGSVSRKTEKDQIVNDIGNEKEEENKLGDEWKEERPRGKELVKGLTERLVRQRIKGARLTLFPKAKPRAASSRGDRIYG